MERSISLVGNVAGIIPKKKRVAAYARVSSGKDAMLHSLAAQIAYYSKVIQKNDAWEYAGVYADEALTGTKETRPEFQRLLSDCRNGKIDIILTKSLSRFARNTVTTLNTVRKLREMNVDVWFERENIHSLSTDGEFMMTILASFAQEESRSASENQKWKIRKDFSEGKSTAVTMMGYSVKNGEFTIIPEEADIVRTIFSDYLSGMGTNAIVKKLRSMNVPTKHEKEWHESVISKMLVNEKYAGDALLQKTFTIDHISKKKINNNGQLPKYFVSESHEPIIDRQTFEAVQAEIVRRSKSKKDRPVAPPSPFRGKIICDKCGKHYRRKIVAKGTRSEKYVWICSTFNTLGKSYCDSQQIPENILLDIVGDEPFREINIPCANKVVIIKADGTQTEHHWENPSRSQSWTDEMKNIARERSLQCQKNQ